MLPLSLKGFIYDSLFRRGRESRSIRCHSFGVNVQYFCLRSLSPGTVINYC